MVRGLYVKRAPAEKLLFADAIDRYQQREGEGIAHYMADLAQRTPFKRPVPPQGT